MALGHLAIIQRTGQFPPYFAPGDGWKYSSTGYNLLGAIIEEVTGQSYDEFIRAEILEPLGMTNTGGDNEMIIERLAKGYSLRDDTVVNTSYFEIDNFRASGNLYSTVEDLFKWGQALYEERLLSRDALELMFTPHVRVNEARHYGYGWSIYERARGHGGSLPGCRCRFMQYPKKKMTVIILGNHDFVLESRMMADLEAMLK